MAPVLRLEEPESEPELDGEDVPEEAAVPVLLTCLVVFVPVFIDVWSVELGFLVVDPPPLAFCSVRLK